MSDFETPLMRDIEKALPKYLLGLLIGLGVVLFFVFPFNITEFCNHGIVTTQGSIFGMIVSDLTGVCI